MNHRSILVTVAATLLAAAATLNTHAQTWETILPLPDTDNWGYALLIDPAWDPNASSVAPIFVGYQSTEYAASAPFGHGSILRLAPDPLNTSSYNVAVVDSEIEQVRRLGYNPANSTLYAVGSRPQVTTPPFPRSNPDVWWVRKSSSGEGTWTTADTFYLSTKASALARGITTGAGGAVYVCGRADLGSGNSHWIVRKLPLGGSWTTVSDLSGGQGPGANGMCFYPGEGSYLPAVFAVGILNSKWTVLRSQNQGASWQTVDTWTYSSKAASTATDAVCDSAGNIYVVGYRDTSIAPTGWVVRMSPDGGNHWFLMVDVGEGAHSWADSVASDGNGNIWVSGMTQNASGIPRTTVLKNGPSDSWPANSVDFIQRRQLPFGVTTWSKGRGVAADASGNNVFVTSELYNWVDGAGSFYRGDRVAVQRLLP